MIDYLVGMDLGLGGKGSPAAIAVLDGSGAHVVTVQTIRAVHEDWVARVLLASAQISVILTNSIRAGSVVVAGIEEAPFVQSHRTAFQLAAAWGIYSAAIWQTLGVVSRPVLPSACKLALAGGGGASKADMILMAQRRYDVSVSEHEADAIGVALASFRDEDRFRGASIS